MPLIEPEGWPNDVRLIDFRSHFDQIFTIMTILWMRDGGIDCGIYVREKGVTVGGIDAGWTISNNFIFISCLKFVVFQVNIKKIYIFLLLLVIKIN